MKRAEDVPLGLATKAEHRVVARLLSGHAERMAATNARLLHVPAHEATSALFGLPEVSGLRCSVATKTAAGARGRLRGQVGVQPPRWRARNATAGAHPDFKGFAP